MKKRKKKYKQMTKIQLNKLAAVVMKDQERITELGMGVKRTADYLSRAAGFKVTTSNVATLIRNKLLVLNSTKPFGGSPETDGKLRYLEKQNDVKSQNQETILSAIHRRVEALEGEVAVVMEELLKLVNKVERIK